jgi:undecaprenyl-diphosphatase
MLSYFEAIVLGILQGITEFFPISSSGHLVLGEYMFGLQEGDFFYFNVLVHMATLVAVLFYFRKKIIKLVDGVLKKDSEQLGIFYALIIGTIPAVIAALLFKDIITESFNNPSIVLKAMLATGFFFIFAEMYATKKVDDEITPKRGLVIGTAQAFALIPGISRSGSTLAMGLMNKLDRVKSAEFSFLLAIPAIAGAGVFTAMDALESAQTFQYGEYFAGFIAALISGYISIKVLMKLYEKHSLYWFAGYLILASIIGHIFVL